MPRATGVSAGDIAKANRRDRLKAKPETIAKREGRGLGQPDSRRAKQIENKKQARNACKASLSQHIGKRPELFHRDPFHGQQSRSLGIVPRLPSKRN